MLGQWSEFTGTTEFLAPNCTTDLGTCNVSDLPLAVVAGKSDTRGNNFYDETINFALPGDAGDINLTITKVSMDDNSAQVWINGEMVLNEDRGIYGQRAYLIYPNVAVGAKLKPGNNPIRGRVYDLYGPGAGLWVSISGSWTTRNPCP